MAWVRVLSRNCKVRLLTKRLIARRTARVIFDAMVVMGNSRNCAHRVGNPFDSQLHPFRRRGKRDHRGRRRGPDQHPTLGAMARVRNSFDRYLAWARDWFATLLLARGEREPEFGNVVGQIAVPIDDLPALGYGRAELRGTTWTAHNISNLPISRGQRCRVSEVKDLTLWISPE